MQTPKGDHLQAVFINRNRASRKHMKYFYGNLDELLCGTITEYARRIHAGRPTRKKQWSVFLVIVPADGEIVPVATTILRDHDDEGVELDVVCGTQSRSPLIQSIIDSMDTRHCQINLTGPHARDVQCGRTGNITFGSIIVCIAIKWALKLCPSTPRLYLKSIPSMASRYGTFGFLPSIRYNTVDEECYIRTFESLTYGPRADTASRNLAQNMVRDYWRENSDGLYYMEMSRDRAKSVCSNRCDSNIGMRMFRMSMPIDV